MKHNQWKGNYTVNKTWHPVKYLTLLSLDMISSQMAKCLASDKNSHLNIPVTDIELYDLHVFHCRENYLGLLVLFECSSSLQLSTSSQQVSQTPIDFEAEYADHIPLLSYKSGHFTQSEFTWEPLVLAAAPWSPQGHITVTPSFTLSDNPRAASVIVLYPISIEKSLLKNK